MSDQKKCDCLLCTIFDQFEIHPVDSKDLLKTISFKDLLEIISSDPDTFEEAIKEKLPSVPIYNSPGDLRSVENFPESWNIYLSYLKDWGETYRSIEDDEGNVPLDFDDWLDIQEAQRTQKILSEKANISSRGRDWPNGNKECDCPGCKGGLAATYEANDANLTEALCRKVKKESEDFFKTLQDKYGDDIINCVSNISAEEFFPGMEAMTPSSYLRRKFYEAFNSIEDTEELVDDIGDTCDQIKGLLHSILTIMRRNEENKMIHPRYDNTCAQEILPVSEIKTGLAELKSGVSIDTIHPDYMKAFIDKRICKLIEKEVPKLLRNKGVTRQEMQNIAKVVCKREYDNPGLSEQLPFFASYNDFREKLNAILNEWIIAHNNTLHKDSNIQSDTTPLQDLIQQIVVEEIQQHMKKTQLKEDKRIKSMIAAEIKKENENK